MFPIAISGTSYYRTMRISRSPTVETHKRLIFLLDHALKIFTFREFANISFSSADNAETRSGSAKNI